MYPDGRMDVLTRGQRRFEIESLSEEKEYLQAEVNFFDDEDADAPTPELRDQALSNYKLLMRVTSAESRPDPDLDDRQLSFQLAHHLPDLDFLSALLRHRSETERLKQLNQYLTMYIPRQRNVERIKELAPTNGHGGTPAGL
jgi:Lon protease-like protein